MAHVQAPYGVQGWVRIRSFSGEPASMLKYEHWWLRPAGSDAWREVARVGGRMHSGSVLALLEGVATREAALALRGAEIGVPRGAMPALPHGEIYWADLVGLLVVNREGLALGQVVAVQEYGGHPVMRVAPGAGERQAERLIPFVAAHVDGVDLPARRIDVDWQPDY
jgi:16S rRNA processing protein RimM